MQLIKLGAAALNQTPLDWEGNAARIRHAMDAARARGVSILCLPELCISGYGCEDAFHSFATQRSALDTLWELLPDTRGLIVSLGLPILHNGGLYNAVAVAVDGQLAGFVAKRFLAGDGIHYEPRWFKPWPMGVTTHLEWLGRRFPLGDLVFRLGGVRIGFEICEDAWVANRPGATLALRGTDVILNPSASHFSFGKLGTRKQFILEGSRAFGCAYVYANLLGNEAGRAIYDGGVLIASHGTLVAQGKRLTFTDCELETAVIDVDALRMSRARSASFAPEAAPEDRVTMDFTFPEAPLELPDPQQEAWEDCPHLKEEEFCRAVALALFDYLRKSRANGFVISLSGGADSAACACLVRLMVDLALANIGEAGVRRKLAHCKLPQPSDPADLPGALTYALLACVYQGTDNSSPTTLNAARAVADAVDAEFLHFDIQTIVDQYIHLAGAAIGRRLDWTTDDVALQNIQARVRSPGAWLLTNVRNALLLATSNRSEAAVGYATMDGDTSGGLSPLGGIDKAFLLRWLSWLQATGPLERGPIPALSAITVQAPTAELRPPGEHQTDETDLMPYPVLDAIERAAIRDKLAPAEILPRLGLLFPNRTKAQLAFWIERFFRLWCRNQWKRERYAPSFHLDDENLDPKTWCRFPILSGGFAKELEQLRAVAGEAS